MSKKLDSLAKEFDHTSFTAEVMRRRNLLDKYGAWLLMFLLLRLVKLDGSVQATHYPFDLDTDTKHIFIDEYIGQGCESYSPFGNASSAISVDVPSRADVCVREVSNARFLSSEANTDINLVDVTDIPAL